MDQEINERDGVFVGQRGGVIWIWRRFGRTDEVPADQQAFSDYLQGYSRN